VAGGVEERAAGDGIETGLNQAAALGGIARNDGDFVVDDAVLAADYGGGLGGGQADGDGSGQNEQEGKEEPDGGGEERNPAGRFDVLCGHGGLEDAEVGRPSACAEDKTQQETEGDDVDADGAGVGLAVPVLELGRWN
jgi:hypothetical protein